MSDEGFYDDCGRYWPADAEWCDRCQGMGTEECLCCGDFCCCGWNERECSQCGGDGYFVPTPAFKKARAETAKWWHGLWAEMDAQGIAAGTDETAQQAQPEGQEPGPKDAPGCQRLTPATPEGE